MNVHKGEVNNSQHRDSNRLISLNKRNWLQALFDWIYGYDFFISYRWSDGRKYALILAEELKKKGYNCFLDTEDYIPGTNWVEGGQRALRRTTRLLLVCTAHALDDPAGRTAEKDPILKELAAFSKGGRQKVRIQIHNLADDIWKQSTVSHYFSQEDLFLQDNRKTPSAKTIEDLDRGCKLEKRDRRRLRIISSVCSLLAVLSIGFGLASWVAVEKRDEALVKTREAIHNLGLSQLREADRLSGEAKNWSAALLIAQTLKLESNYKYQKPATEADGHVNLESLTGQNGLVSLNTLLDYALIPQKDVAFFNLPQTRYTLSSHNNGTVISINEDHQLQSVSTGGKGQVSILSGDHRAQYLSEQLTSGGEVLWVDNSNNLYAFSFKTLKNKLLTKLEAHAPDIAEIWLSSDSTMVGYLYNKDLLGESVLRIKDLSSDTVTEFSGAWREKSRAVFVSDQYLVICGEDPFPEESGISSTWNIVLYDVNQVEPLSVIEIEPQLYSGQSGAVYPDITSILLLDDELLTVGIGGDDGAVRIFTVENNSQPQTARHGALKLKRTLTQDGNSHPAITSLASTEDGVIIMGGTKNGRVLSWDVQVGQLLNSSRTGSSPVTNVAYNRDNYFSLDSIGKLIRWRDRPFIERISLPGTSMAEIVDIRNTGENGFEVYSDQGQIYRYQLSGTRLILQNGVGSYDLATLPEESVLKRKELGIDEQKVFDSFSTPIVSLAVTAQKEGAIICFSTGEVEMWNLDRSGIPIEKRWRALNPGSAEVGAHIALSPDDSKVAITGYAMNDTDKWGNILSTKDGSELYRFQGDAVGEWGNDHPVIFLADGKYLVSGLYSYIYLWPTQMPYFRASSKSD